MKIEISQTANLILTHKSITRRVHLYEKLERTVLPKTKGRPHKDRVKTKCGSK